MSAVATLKAILGLEGVPQYKAGMRDATGATMGFQKSLAAAGRMIGAAFSVGALMQAGRSLVSWASNASQAAQNAGILTSEMIALNQVGLQGGLAVDDMGKMLSKLQNELFSAAGGSAESAKKFQELGLSVEDLARMDPTSMLQAVARAAFNTATPLQMLSDVFGDKLGPKAVSVLRDIAQNGLPEVGEAVGRTADQIEALGDKWDLFADRAKASTTSFLSKLVDGGAIIKNFVKGWIGENDGGNNLGFMESIRAKFAAGRWAVSNAIYQEEATRVLSGKERSDFAAQQTAELTKRAQATAEDAAWKDQAKKQDRIDNIRQQAAEQVARLTERGESFRSLGGGADSMARMGGFVGPQRGGLGQADRQLQVGMETKRVMEEIRRIQEKAAADIERIADAQEGLP